MLHVIHHASIPIAVLLFSRLRVVTGGNLVWGDDLLAMQKEESKSEESEYGIRQEYGYDNYYDADSYYSYYDDGYGYGGVVASSSSGSASSSDSYVYPNTVYGDYDDAADFYYRPYDGGYTPAIIASSESDAYVYPSTVYDSYDRDTYAPSSTTTPTTTIPITTTATSTAYDDYNDIYTYDYNYASSFNNPPISSGYDYYNYIPQPSQVYSTSSSQDTIIPPIPSLSPPPTYLPTHQPTTPYPSRAPTTTPTPYPTRAPTMYPTVTELPRTTSWVQLFSVDFNEHYYWNVKTGEVRWAVPEEEGYLPSDIEVEMVSSTSPSSSPTTVPSSVPSPSPTTAPSTSSPTSSSPISSPSMAPTTRSPSVSPSTALTLSPSKSPSKPPSPVLKNLPIFDVTEVPKVATDYSKIDPLTIGAQSSKTPSQIETKAFAALLRPKLATVPANTIISSSTTPSLSATPIAQRKLPVLRNVQWSSKRSSKFETSHHPSQIREAPTVSTIPASSMSLTPSLMLAKQQLPVSSSSFIPSPRSKNKNIDHNKEDDQEQMMVSLRRNALEVPPTSSTTLSPTPIHISAKSCAELGWTYQEIPASAHYSFPKYVCVSSKVLDNGNTCSSSNDVYSFKQARSICFALGARMCSAEELKAGAAINVDLCESTSNSKIAVWSSEYCKETQMTRDILSGVTSVMRKSRSRPVTTTTRSDSGKSSNKVKRLYRTIQQGGRSDSSGKEDIDVVDTEAEVTVECSPFHSKLHVRCCADVYPNN